MPDALSRAPAKDPCTIHLTYTSMLSTIKDSPRGDLPFTDDVLWKTQQEGTEAKEMYQSLLEMGVKLINLSTKHAIFEYKVYSYPAIHQVYSPDLLRSEMLRMFHEDPITGHLGKFKTSKRLQGFCQALPCVPSIQA